MGRQGKGLRLILFPAPLRGHMNPMLQLAYILHSKGFSITIIHTHFDSPNPSNHPHFNFHPINDGLSQEQATAKLDFNTSIALIMQLNQTCVQPFRDCLAKLLADDKQEPVPCLITDLIWPFTQPIADAHNLPRIVLRADSQLELPANAMECPRPLVKDMAAIFLEKREAFSNFIANVGKTTEAALGMIWNSFKELEHPQVAVAPCRITRFPSNLTFLIGPTHKYFPPSSSSTAAADRACISWLDSQPPKSVVYVSFGSLAVLEESDLVEMAWGLANSKQKFLWVVRPGSVGGSEWIEKLPDGFVEAVGEKGHMIIKWAPQLQVLGHPATGCFWTHNGWNSTVEGICEGVPMICSPCFVDHFVSAKYVTDYWKVGLKLENGLERGEIEKAIKTVMVEKQGEEMRERIMCLKEKADNCLKEGGSSFKALQTLVDHIKSFK